MGPEADIRCEHCLSRLPWLSNAFSGRGFMRVLFLAAALSLAFTSASAQTPPAVERLEVLERGLYSAASENCSPDERRLIVCDVANVRHVSTSTNVPAQVGVLFGARFRVVGTPNGATVSLRKVWILPPAGLRAPTVAEPIQRIERVEQNVIGAIAVATYGFDEAWELVPGTWTLQFWDGDRLLLSEQFDVALRIPFDANAIANVGTVDRGRGWVAPGNVYGLNYPEREWIVVPARSVSDQTLLRLAPRNFDPTAPRLCSARHYHLNPAPGWEASFPQWARETADQVSAQNAAQMFALPGGRVDRVEHSDVGDTRVADVYLAGVPLGGLNFNIRYRVFAVRGVSGPIMVQLDCRASQILGPGVFQGLDSILNSLRIPG